MPKYTLLQGPIDTRAKMSVYASLVNYVVYACTKCAFWENGSSFMIAMKITLTRNRQYGGSSNMPCLSLSAI